MPGQSFGWIERPPGVSTITGIPWMAKVLYPEKFRDLDLKSLTKKFYAEFYYYDLSDREVMTILNASGLKTIKIKNELEGHSAQIT